MTQQHKKISENKTAITAANATRGNNTVQLKDNREYSLVQRKLQENVENSAPENTFSNTGVAQLNKKKRKSPESDEENSSDEEEVSDEESKSYDEISSDEEEISDDDSDYEPPQPATKQQRFHIPALTTEDVIRQTAHKRKNVNNKYKEIFTCPACKRPLASTKKGSKTLDLTRYAFTSKGGNKHEQRALTLDHYPPWAERLNNLKSRNATNDEIKEDHNDPERLRALCKVCNESHKYENTKNVDYESDSEEEGYSTGDDEPDNKGFYKDFRKDPDPGSGSAGIIT